MLIVDGENLQVTERIIFYPEMIAFGGAERILLALSRHLHQREIAHQLALYYLATDLQSHADWPLPIRELRPPRSPLLKAKALRHYLQTEQTTKTGTALLVGIQAALHAGMLRSNDYTLMILDTPSLLSNRAESQTLGARAKRKVRELACRRVLQRGVKRARTVIATSRYMADEIKQLYGRESVIARQGGLSPLRASRVPTANDASRVRLLSVSRLEANKRIDWILRALCAPELRNWLNHQDPSWRLEIVGDGADRLSLQMLASSLGLGAHAHFLGHVPDARLEEAYANATLFVMPAFQGYGLPGLEALARHVPVVMHRESGVSEILQGTPWVELIDGSVASLAAGMFRSLCRIQAGIRTMHPLPAFPSEADWAEEICRICGWSQSSVRGPVLRTDQEP